MTQAHQKEISCRKGIHFSRKNKMKKKKEEEMIELLPLSSSCVSSIFFFLNNSGRGRSTITDCFKLFLFERETRHYKNVILSFFYGCFSSCFNSVDSRSLYILQCLAHAIFYLPSWALSDQSGWEGKDGSLKSNEMVIIICVQWTEIELNLNYLALMAEQDVSYCW